MSKIIPQRHRIVLTLSALLAVCWAGSVLALPQDRILIVEASFIEGLAEWHGEVEETRSTLFDSDGGSMRIDAEILASLEGLQAVFLVERQRDSQGTVNLERRYWQEIHPVRDGSIELAMIRDEPFSYQIASVDGEPGLFGQGNLLRAEGGEGEPFQVWRIDALRLVDRDALLPR